MKRKLVQIGRSLAVTLPSEVVRDFALQKGEEVEVSVHPVTGAITIRPGVKQFEDGECTVRFRGMADALADRFAEAFEELAK